MQDHTPGEWEAVGGRIIAKSTKYAITVAQIPVGLPSKQRTANAKLMAAAPELLEALIWLRDQIPNLEGSIGMDKVNQAIAKATPQSLQS